MTKRFTIVMVALALFVLMAIAPVSAIIAANGTQIQVGSTVFIGEGNLNLTQALNGAKLGGSPNNGNLYQSPAAGDLKIGWWASAAQITTTAPTKVINLAGRYNTFEVAAADFVGYTGNWYLIANTSAVNAADLSVGGQPQVVISVQDPALTIAAWDFVQATDVTGKSVPQGTHLGVQINTNMYPATYAGRNNTVLNMTASVYSTVLTAPFYGKKPDGTVFNPVAAGALLSANSTWSTVADVNPTNNTYIYQTGYPNQQGANVWMVLNYTELTIMTWDANGTTGKYGTWGTMYWNNTPVTTGTLADPYSSKNYTTLNTGLPSLTTPGVAPGVACTFDSWTFTTVAPAGFAPYRNTDGFINLKIKDESGATYNQLMVGTLTGGYAATSTFKNFVNVQPFFFGSSTAYWVTDAVDFNNQYMYPVGTYSITAESALNKMKDNYKNAGADYTGKTVSPTGTVTLVSDSVKIEANKDSVVRSKPFSVTVTGKPSTTYYVWVKGTRSMDGAYDNTPPMVNINQEKVYNDNQNWATGGVNSAGTVPPTGFGVAYHPIADYYYENGGGNANGQIWADVCTDANAVAGQNWNRTRYYTLINTSTSGTRTVEFVTNNWTKAQKYTIRVEQNFPTTTSGFGAGYQATGSVVKSDEVDVKVEKGAVTIVAAGDQSYYLGEEIKFSGTNTESYKTYLFIIGPNLKQYGSQIQSTNPRMNAVVDNVAASFKQVDVNGDNTWSWKWGTSTVALDAGTYTIYAVSQPRDSQSDHLDKAAYGTVSIIIKKPFVSATASQSTVAQGDKIFITGTAEGQPIAVMIWILGKNYPTDAAGVKTESVNSDASFKFEVTQAATKNLYPGQYFVVVQHPMQNNVFDVKPVTEGTNTFVKNMQLNTAGSTAGTNVFTLLGASSLQGSDAAEALVQGINDPNVDDTYTKLQFLIEVPVIRVDPVGDKHVGDKFTITAQTNLAVDDEVLVQVYSSSFKPTQKSQSGEFSGATGTVKVAKGDAGMNKISFDVDSSTFKPDEYIVTESAVLQVATGTALFNVLEGAAPTAAPTVVVTTAAVPVTTVAPVVTTAAPTPVPTTKSPGYGALIALIGLGAVAFIVVRRH